MNGRVVIPVLAIEFDSEGNTLWVQGEGGTVLRIKTMGRIVTEECTTSPVCHGDIVVREDIRMCLAGLKRRRKRKRG